MISQCSFIDTWQWPLSGLSCIEKNTAILPLSEVLATSGFHDCIFWIFKVLLAKKISDSNYTDIGYWPIHMNHYRWALMSDGPQVINKTLTYLSPYFSITNTYIKATILTRMTWSDRKHDFMAIILLMLVYSSKINIYLNLGILVAECYVVCIVFCKCSENIE